MLLWRVSKERSLQKKKRLKISSNNKNIIQIIITWSMLVTMFCFLVIIAIIIMKGWLSYQKLEHYFSSSLASYLRVHTAFLENFVAAGQKRLG